jgi:hypothetical protein
LRTPLLQRNEVALMRAVRVAELKAFRTPDEILE